MTTRLRVFTTAGALFVAVGVSIGRASPTVTPTAHADIGVSVNGKTVIYKGTA